MTSSSTTPRDIFYHRFFAAALGILIFGIVAWNKPELFSAKKDDVLLYIGIFVFASFLMRIHPSWKEKFIRLCFGLILLLGVKFGTEPNHIFTIRETMVIISWLLLVDPILAFFKWQMNRPYL